MADTIMFNYHIYSYAGKSLANLQDLWQQYQIKKSRHQRLSTVRLYRVRVRIRFGRTCYVASVWLGHNQSKICIRDYKPDNSRCCFLVKCVQLKQRCFYTISSKLEVFTIRDVNLTLKLQQSWSLQLQ